MTLPGFPWLEWLKTIVDDPEPIGVVYQFLVWLFGG